MKFFRLILLSAGLVGLCTTVNAQIGYYNDALLFSQTSYNGSARVQGIGGTQVALGGDVSLANSNPAGLGFFNRSVFSITPALDFNTSDANFFGQSTHSFKNNFNFNQIGGVINYGKGDIVQSKFKGGSLAISLNRINNFHNEINYDNYNNESSVVDSFIDAVGDAFPEDLGGLNGAAYDHFLIEEADYNSDIDYFLDEVNGRTYITPNFGDGTIEGYSSLVGRFAGSLPRQNEVLELRGAQYQFNVAWGGNYDDRLYFGGGIGIQSVDYTQKRTFLETEYAFGDGSPDNILNAIEITDRLDIEGAGINATVGLIARPVEYVTIGISYISPTYLALNEESDYIFSTDWNSNYSYISGTDTTELGFISTASDIFISDYTLKTPSKVNLGTALFLGKYGFVSGDLEFVDYSNALLKSSDFVVTEDNNAIKDIYESVVNFRMGGELRFEEIRVRGGYSRQADPYKNSEYDRTISSTSFGLGYRTRDYFVDLALINRKGNNFYNPYTLASDSPVVELENETTTLAVTVGFTF